MTDTPYTPPRIWTWDKASGGRFANINRPVAGPTHDKALPVGRHPLQLYSMGTPNGVKVTILLEELLAAVNRVAHGRSKAEKQLSRAEAERARLRLDGLKRDE